MQKQCFKCGVFKAIESFYTHARMADGHLNKCKECTRKEEALRLETKKSDPAWLVKEAQRSRVAAQKRRGLGLVKPRSRQQAITVMRTHRELHPMHFRARNLVEQAVKGGSMRKKPCAICGCLKAEAHHENYDKPLDVVWLCKKHHMERHVEINNAKRLAIAGK